jgi:hypothetical protein
MRVAANKPDLTTSYDSCLLNVLLGFGFLAESGTRFQLVTLQFTAQCLLKITICVNMAALCIVISEFMEIEKHDECMCNYECNENL